MISTAIQASVEAVRYWTWESREAWMWLTECQQMRDLLNDPVRTLAPDAFAQFLGTHNFRQYEWYLEHYYHHQSPPSDARIDWQAIRTRWLAIDPAQTIILSAEDRARCLVDHWHEYRLTYPQGAPLRIVVPSEDDYEAWAEAGGGGWVYWREKCINHYTYPYEQLADAREMNHVCLYLEEIGVPVTIYTACYHQGRFLAMEPGHPYIPLLPHLLCYQIWDEPSGQIAFTHLFDCRDEKGVVRTLYFDGALWHKIRSYSDTIEPWLTLKKTRECFPFDYRAMASLRWEGARMGQAEHEAQIHADLSGVCSWLQAHQISPTFLDAKGGPWCLVDDAALCPGCAGQLRQSV